MKDASTHGLAGFQQFAKTKDQTWVPERPVPGSIGAEKLKQSGGKEFSSSLTCSSTSGIIQTGRYVRDLKGQVPRGCRYAEAVAQRPFSLFCGTRSAECRPYGDLFNRELVVPKIQLNIGFDHLETEPKPHLRLFHTGVNELGNPPFPFLLEGRP